jgi:uncharacterized repeat protein (TIGR01451 family)
MGLNASHNQLTSVNVNFGNFIQDYEPRLDLSFNNLTTFSISNATFYDGFFINNNQLTSLNINNCDFGGFSVAHNNLTAINFTGNNYIYSSANFAYNQFTLLDLVGAGIDYECSVYLGYNIEDRVQNLFGGEIYYASNNTFFDLGDYRGITSCDPEGGGRVTIINSPNLRNVNFKNGYNHMFITCDEGGTIFQNPSINLQISNCPNLTYICTDELEQNTFQTWINWMSLQDQIQVNTYCTFTPGGTFYTINGNTQFDVDADGCEASDPIVPNQRFTITNGIQNSTIIANDLGNYNINVGAGTHTITPILDNPTMFTVLPTNVTVNFPTESSPRTENFCIAATSPAHDFDITLVPIGRARPGFDVTYKIVYKNTGNVTDSGNINLTYEDNVMDFVSSSVTPSDNSTGNLSWDFTNLAPFETRSIDITFNLNGPMETPPLAGGEILHFTSSIAETGISEPFPNYHQLNETVVNSWDPNDKTCLEGQNLSNDFLGNYVSYRIRFENTGTYAAENIVVKDMIDTAKFDIATLTPIAGSHQFYTRINGNKVEFIFENINLPFDDANNDGYVVFKIKLLPSVTENIPFENQASIYFDYNFPVVTNTATSVIGILGIPTLDLTDNFILFPVPAKNVLQILSKENLEIRSVEIYNNLGQILQKEIGNQQNINVSNLVQGNYYLKIQTSNATSVKQFLKE